ncbi:hypothetical protein L0244_39205 [bacterium]|nr:hypothetical protein [bacterium]
MGDETLMAAIESVLPPEKTKNIGLLLLLTDVILFTCRQKKKQCTCGVLIVMGTIRCFYPPGKYFDGPGSADSKWVFCSTSEDNKQHLLKISIDGSQQKVLATHLFIGGVTISPDGKQTAYPYRQNDTSPLVMNIIFAGWRCSNQKLSTGG